MYMLGNDKTCFVFFHPLQRFIFLPENVYTRQASSVRFHGRTDLLSHEESRWLRTCQRGGRVNFNYFLVLTGVVSSPEPQPGNTRGPKWRNSQSFSCDVMFQKRAARMRLCTMRKKKSQKKKKKKKRLSGDMDGVSNQVPKKKTKKCEEVHK